MSTSRSPSVPSRLSPPPAPQPAGPSKPVVQPKKGGGRTSVLVNACQRGNPIIQHIKNVPWEYADIVPDYQVGSSTGVLFLSLRYHRLHPEYVHTRISKLAQMYTLRVLLLMCDINDHQEPIRELTKVCLINNLTVMVAWSAEQAARYLTLYTTLEHRPPDLIRERTSSDYMSTLTAALTSIKSVNKTDVLTLATSFGSFREIVRAPPETLSLCPGFGGVKVRRLREAFDTPFRSSSKHSLAPSSAARRGPTTQVKVKGRVQEGEEGWEEEGVGWEEEERERQRQRETQKEEEEEREREESGTPGREGKRRRVNPFATRAGTGTPPG